MLTNIFLLAVSLVFVIRGSIWATTYAGRLAANFNLSKYTIGFLIVAVISILPETFIAIRSSFDGLSAFGLGTLFGSNIADLTIVFAIIILLVGRGIKVESRILKSRSIYPFLLLLPLILGFNGHYSRLEGLALIVAGGIFYYYQLKNGMDGSVAAPAQKEGKLKNLGMLLLSMLVLLVGAHFTVESASDLAVLLGISPILIGMLIVGLGTTIPELMFALRSFKSNDDSMAIGDVLGTVLADATIVVGLLALVRPFAFPQKIVFVTGGFMLVASIVLFNFMRSGRHLSRREAYVLVTFWLFFVLVEFLINS